MTWVLPVSGGILPAQNYRSIAKTSSQPVQHNPTEIHIKYMWAQSRNDLSAFLMQWVQFSSFSAFWCNSAKQRYTLNAFELSRGLTFLHLCCKGCPFLHFLHFGATQPHRDIPWMHLSSVDDWLFCIYAAKGVLFWIFCILGQLSPKEIHLKWMWAQSKNVFSAILLQRVSFSGFSAFEGKSIPKTYTLNECGHSQGMTFLHFCCKGCPFLHFLHFDFLWIQ